MFFAYVFASIVAPVFHRIESLAFTRIPLGGALAPA
jgi:hypothetical protein